MENMAILENGAFYRLDNFIFFVDREITTLEYKNK